MEPKGIIPYYELLCTTSDVKCQEYVVWILEGLKWHIVNFRLRNGKLVGSPQTRKLPPCRIEAVA